MSVEAPSEQDTRFQRQSDHLSEAMRRTGINIIGAGSVGSHIVYTLAKMGFRGIRVFDMDSLETHNISNQFCKHTAVGQTKTFALKTLIQEMDGVKIQAISEKFEDQTILPGIVIFAMDSIKAREDAWYSIKDRPGVELVIDIRMGLESLEMFGINPHLSEDAEFYEKHLDPKVTQAPCTARTVLYTVNFATGLACWTVARYVREESYKRYHVADLKNLNFITPKEADE